MPLEPTTKRRREQTRSAETRRRIRLQTKFETIKDIVLEHKGDNKKTKEEIFDLVIQVSLPNPSKRK